MRKLLALIAVGAIAFAACGGGEPTAESTAPDETTTTEAVEETTTTAAPTTTSTTQPTTTTTRATTTTTAAGGSFENPLNGATHTLLYGDWEIGYGGGRIGVEEVLDENMFNDPPPEGTTFVIIPLTGTYSGAESADLWHDFNYSVVGGKGNTFDEDCGVNPDELYDQGEVFTGASVTGNVCVIVPLDQLEGAKLMIEPRFTINDVRGYFWLNVTP